MRLAENAPEIEEKKPTEEVESAGAKKRRELRAAIKSALEKLREESVEKRTPEQASLADMFSYMRGLCNYLPQPKKSLFMSSEERVRLEYVINKLKSTPGLFNETEEVVKVIKENDDSNEEDDSEKKEILAEKKKPTREEISDVILWLQNMLKDNMKDKELASALNAKVRSVLERFDAETLQF